MNEVMIECRIIWITGNWIEYVICQTDILKNIKMLEYWDIGMLGHWNVGTKKYLLV